MATTALREIIPDWNLDDAANTRLDQELLARAYHFSAEAHLGQTRNSGDPYVTHCVEVAKILADLQLDTTTVVSGLIHDVVEDTKITVADVEREFGKEIAAIVDGLTKIAKLPTGGSNQDRQVESYRKLLLSIAKDARVIIVKLADRLHNMRTLDFLSEENSRPILTPSIFSMNRLLPSMPQATLLWHGPARIRMVVIPVFTRRGLTPMAHHSVPNSRSTHLPTMPRTVRLWPWM